MAEVDISFRDGVGLAVIQGRRGIGPMEIGEKLGFEVPPGPGYAAHGPLALVGIGPDAWLAVHGEPPAAWPDCLCTRLARTAAVFDQSAGYRIIRVGGGGARALLQSGCTIDLDGRSFGLGSSASTVIAHIAVILWQVDDAPLFELAFYRSFSASMVHWFEMAAQTHCTVAAPSSVPRPFLP